MDQLGPNLIFLVLVVGLFYFLLIRPQRRRVERHQRLIESIELGDEVVTYGGLVGTVRRLGDEELEIEIAPNITARFMKSHIIRKIVGPGEEETG